VDPGVAGGSGGNAADLDRAAGDTQVDGSLAYVLGTVGDLLALSVKTGEVAWRKSFRQDYGSRVPSWGMTGAPIVVDDLLIAVVGGQDSALVVGFRKTTGEEVWRALSSEHGQGYSAPILIDRGRGSAAHRVALCGRQLA